MKNYQKKKKIKKNNKGIINGDAKKKIPLKILQNPLIMLLKP